jgi:hypothetical protein
MQYKPAQSQQSTSISMKVVEIGRKSTKVAKRSNSEHSSNIDKSISCRVLEFHFSGCFNE